MWKLYHIVGAPSKENYKGLLRSNQKKNCSVVKKDIDIAQAIFGEGIPPLKCKTVQKTPGVVV